MSTASNNQAPITEPLTSDTPHHDDTGDDANEGLLRSMFPDLDHAAIHDCYVLCERNVERTIEFLLGTDSEAPARVNDPPANTHDMDEQLARQLEQEELAMAGTERVFVNPNPNQNPNFNAPRRQPTLPTGAGVSGNPPDDEPSLQDQFMKIAETGKKTFNTIFSKVKEKLKEFEESSTTNPSQPSYYPPPSAPGNTNTPYASTSRPAAVGVPNQATPTIPSASPAQSTPAVPVAVVPPQASTSAPVIETSKAAFLDRKPTQLVETHRSHPEEDLTENPFEDQTH